MVATAYDGLTVPGLGLDARLSKFANYGSILMSRFMD